jgi:hypothetical protein
MLSNDDRRERHEMQSGAFEFSVEAVNAIITFGDGY